MFKRLIWDFTIDIGTSSKVIELAELAADTTLKNKWEKRFFWPDDYEVIIKGLDETFLNLSHYKLKVHDDVYLINPNTFDNIKLRKDKLHIKALIEEKDSCYQFAKKKKYKLPQQLTELSAEIPELANYDSNQSLQHYLSTHYRIAPVYKEALIYSLNEYTKFELSRLSIGNQHYHSLCIESKKKPLLEALAAAMVEKTQTQSYVQFLKGLKQC